MNERIYSSRALAGDLTAAFEFALMHARRRAPRCTRGSETAAAESNA